MATILNKLHVFEQLTNRNVLELWDELGTLTSTNGLKKSGDGSCQGSKFLSLYNDSQAISQEKSNKQYLYCCDIVFMKLPLPDMRILLHNLLQHIYSVIFVEFLALKS